VTTRRYEGFFLIDNNRANQAWDATVTSISELLERFGGTIVRTLKWEERKLAYEINGHRRGTYLLIYFDAEPGSIDTIRREFGLSDIVMRSLFLRLTTPMLEGPQDLYANGAATEETPAAPAKAPAEEEEAKAEEPAGKVSVASDGAGEQAASGEPPVSQG
jgi:ribosomal protein S6